MPTFLAGRERQIRRFRRALMASPELPVNFCLTGLRGVGKTVLLKHLEEQATECGWVVSRKQLEPRHNSNAGIIELVSELAGLAGSRQRLIGRTAAKIQEITQAARKMAVVQVGEDLAFSLSGDPEVDDSVTAPIVACVNECLKAGKEGYILMLDEAQVLADQREATGNHALSLLIAGINTLQEEGMPVVLVLCGLPTLRTNMQRARTYSERMFRVEEIGSLSAINATEAFVKPLAETALRADPQLVERVVNEVEGYPYFVQLWGYELWETARDLGVSVIDSMILDNIESEIYDRLDREFYRSRVDTLTPSEQDLLEATAKCSYPPLSTANIRAKSKKSSGNVNVLMGRLVTAGVVFRTGKGTYEYSAPKFHDYLVRRTAAMGKRST